MIKRIVERVSHRVFRVVALPAPTEREKSQMYVQRYIRHMPAAGEVVIFEMLAATDAPFAPWYIVNADDKRRARLNCISHLLSLIPYKEIKHEPIKLPKRQKSHGYVEPRNRRYNVVPEIH